jgi:phospholipid transport system substrate-binding protein
MKFARYLLVLLLGIMLVAPARAETASAPGSATSIVSTFYGHLLDVMKRGDQLGFEGRYQKLDPVIKTAFDLPQMTRFAVGSVWADASADEQKQLIDAFSDFSVANYASRFSGYNGEKFEILDEKPSSGSTIVETRLTPKNGDPVMLNYLMRKDSQGSWRIVDVFLNGTISELATRRAEFSSIVKRDGINALVNSLGEKSKQMGAS